LAAELCPDPLKRSSYLYPQQKGRDEKWIREVKGNKRKGRGQKDDRANESMKGDLPPATKGA